MILNTAQGSKGRKHAFFLTVLLLIQGIDNLSFAKENPKCSIQEQNVKPTCTEACCRDDCRNEDKKVYILKIGENLQIYFSHSKEGKTLAEEAAEKLEEGNLCSYKANKRSKSNEKNSVCVLSHYGANLDFSREEIKYYSTIISTGNSGPTPVIEARFKAKEAATQNIQEMQNIRFCDSKKLEN